VRILMVAHSDSPWTPLYAPALQARGHEVLVASFSPQPVPGVETVFVGEPARGWYPAKRLYLTRAPRIRSLIEARRPDVVLAAYLLSNGAAVLLAGWRGPFVVSAQGGDVMPCDYPKPYFLLRRQVARRVCAHAHAVHVVSAQLAEAVAALGVPRERIQCFPTGIDLRTFAARGAARRPGPPRLVCTRKLDTIYDNGTILQALAELRRRGRRFEFVFAGEGPLRAALAAKARRLGLAEEVRFAGAQSHAAIAGLLRDADVYVSASLSDGTSASLLEALACGSFPVVTRIAANEAWVAPGETGLLFEPRSARELAGALDRALQDEALRAGASRRNRERIERDANLELTMASLARMLEEVALRGRPRA
jgi:glycosyltransferase involved in cell wall biosynthesis